MSETPIFEGALPGIFVPTPIIRELDTCLSVLFVAIQSARHYMAETDDGSLEWQLLRRALHESFFDLHRLLDAADLLEESSKYPEEMRPNPNDRATRQPPTDESLAGIVQVGRTLLRQYLLARELQANDDRRLILLIEQGTPQVEPEGDRP